jgi:hypothetical protein
MEASVRIAEIPGPGVRVRYAHRDCRVGESGRADVVLVAGDDVAVAVTYRACSDARRVGTAVRLRHREAHAHFALDHRRHEASHLVVGCVLHQRADPGRPSPIAQHVREENRTRCGDVILQSAQVGERDPLAREIARQVDAVETQLPAAAPDGSDKLPVEPIFVAQAEPTLHRDQFLLQVLLQGGTC